MIQKILAQGTAPHKTHLLLQLPDQCLKSKRGETRPLTVQGAQETGFLLKSGEDSLLAEMLQQNKAKKTH